MSRLAIAATALALFSLESCAKPLSASVHAGYMKLEMTGNLALAPSSGPADLDSRRIDIEDGFGISESESVFVEAQGKIRDWSLGLSGFRFEDTGATTLPNPFGDIPGGTPVTTDLEVWNVKAFLAYDLEAFGWWPDIPFLSFDVGLAIDYFGVDTRVEASSISAFEDMKWDAPMPMLYARVGADVSIVRAEIEACWMNLSLADAGGSFFDLDASVAVTPFPFLEVMAGYRNILIDADGELDGQAFDTHMRLSGFYLAAGVNF